MSDIKDAIGWWLCENCIKQKGKFTSLEALLTYFFDLADSLYCALKEEPVEPIDKQIEWFDFKRFGIKKNGCRNILYIVNPLSNKDFFRLRGMLALAGDMIHIVEGLKHLHKSLDNGNNNALIKILDSPLGSLEKYRYARGFFAHLDERMGSKIDTHGVTGELEIPELCLTFPKDAKGCFYFGFTGNTVYFHDRQLDEAEASPKSVSFDKQGMFDMFSLVRALYDLVTSHSIHAQNYPPSGAVYDLS